MIKYLFNVGFLIVAFLFLLSSAYSETKKSPQPKIEIKENTWDFGYIPENEVVTHTFIIRNVGDDSLFITKVRTTCCCTHAPLSRSRLGPKEKAEIEVSLNSRRLKEDVQKAIYISSNDTIARFSSIFIGAKVGTQNEMVELFPDKVWFKEGEKNKTLWVKNISDSFIQISVPGSPKSPVEFKIDKMNLNPFDSTQISFNIKEDEFFRPFKTSLTLDFSGVKKIRCTIPIRTIGDK